MPFIGVSIISKPIIAGPPAAPEFMLFGPGASGNGFLRRVDEDGNVSIVLTFPSSLSDSSVAGFDIDLNTGNGVLYWRKNTAPTNGILYRTQNYGNNWAAIAGPIAASVLTSTFRNSASNNIRFANFNATPLGAFLIFGDDNSGGVNPNLWYSLDGGATWTSTIETVGDESLYALYTTHDMEWLATSLLATVLGNSLYVANENAIVLIPVAPPGGVPKFYNLKMGSSPTQTIMSPSNVQLVGDGAVAPGGVAAIDFATPGRVTTFLSYITTNLTRYIIEIFHWPETGSFYALVSDATVGGFLYESTDNGASWTEITTLPNPIINSSQHAHMRNIAVGKRLYASDSAPEAGGISSSRDGLSWKDEQAWRFHVKDQPPVLNYCTPNFNATSYPDFMLLGPSQGTNRLSRITEDGTVTTVLTFPAAGSIQGFDIDLRFGTGFLYWRNDLLTDGRLYKTIDYGETWAQVLVGPIVAHVATARYMASASNNISYRGSQVFSIIGDHITGGTSFSYSITGVASSILAIDDDSTYRTHVSHEGGGRVLVSLFTEQIEGPTTSGLFESPSPPTFSPVPNTAGDVPDFRSIKFASSPTKTIMAPANIQLTGMGAPAPGGFAAVDFDTSFVPEALFLGYIEPSPTSYTTVHDLFYFNGSFWALISDTPGFGGLSMRNSIDGGVTWNTPALWGFGFKAGNGVPHLGMRNIAVGRRMYALVEGGGPNQTHVYSSDGVTGPFAFEPALALLARTSSTGNIESLIYCTPDFNLV